VNQTITFDSRGGDYSAGGVAPLRVSGGVYNLRSSGGDVPAFNVNLNFQTLTVNDFGFPSGTTTISRSRALTLAWTCPDASATVVAEVASIDASKSLFGYTVCSASCGAGRLTISADTLQQLPPSGSTQAFVILQLLPNWGTTPRIPGVDLGGFFGLDNHIYGTLNLQ